MWICEQSLIKWYVVRFTGYVMFSVTIRISPSLKCQFEYICSLKFVFCVLTSTLEHDALYVLFFSHPNCKAIKNPTQLPHFLVVGHIRLPGSNQPLDLNFYRNFFIPHRSSKLTFDKDIKSVLCPLFPIPTLSPTRSWLGLHCLP